MTDRCNTCGHDPVYRINRHHECSHVDCPNRRRAWSEQPKPQDFPPPPKVQHRPGIEALFDEQEV